MALTLAEASDAHDAQFFPAAPGAPAAPATACGGGNYGQPDRANSQLSFGVAMAQRGLWSEALFRFHQAERLDPQNPRVLNNLGVAYEAAGEYEQALEYYQRPSRSTPSNRELRANYARFVEFYQSFKPTTRRLRPPPDSLLRRRDPAATPAPEPADGTAGRDAACRSRRATEPPPL